MFKKKNKHVVEQEEVEQEIIEVTSKDISETLIKSDNEKEVKQDKPSKFFSFKKEEPEDEKLPKEEQEVVLQEIPKEDFIWANSPEHEEQLAKENKKKKKRKKSKKEEVEDVEEVKVPQNKEEKKELSTYFDANKDNSKKSNRKDKHAKINTEAGKKQKKQSKRQSKRDQLEEDVKNKKLFRYDNKKYIKVEDFITFLNQHYLDIEKISEEVLDNENFFGWINKNSGVFNQSLKEYKEIKAKIENK